MSNYKPYADLKYKTRSYTDKEGKEKGIWLQVGTIFATPHLSSMFQVMEALPINFDGKLSIFKREDFEQLNDEPKDTSPTHELNKHTTDVVLKDIEEKPINLSEIPF